MLTPEQASRMLRTTHTRSGGKIRDQGMTDFFVDHALIDSTKDFDLFLRWMCRRSDYLVLCDAEPWAGTSALEYLRDVFGWVDCEVSSEVRYGTTGPAVYSYFLPCHSGQFEPLRSTMHGLFTYTDACPVEDLAFVDRSGLPRLVTVTHEKLAWLTIPTAEYREAQATQQNWTRALKRDEGL